jgi:hypothetical protein
MNDESGITIDRDISGAKDKYMFLTKMIQKDEQPQAFYHP